MGKMGKASDSRKKSQEEDEEDVGQATEETAKGSAGTTPSEEEDEEDKEGKDATSGSSEAGSGSGDEEDDHKGSGTEDEGSDESLQDSPLVIKELLPSISFSDLGMTASEGFQGFIPGGEVSFDDLGGRDNTRQTLGTLPPLLTLASADGPKEDLGRASFPRLIVEGRLGAGGDPQAGDMDRDRPLPPINMGKDAGPYERKGSRKKSLRETKEIRSNRGPKSRGLPQQQPHAPANVMGGMETMSPVDQALVNLGLNADAGDYGEEEGSGSSKSGEESGDNAFSKLG